MPSEVAREITSGNTLQNILLGVGAVGATLWAVWEKVQRIKLSTSASDAGVAVNDAQEKMFLLMTSRLEALEMDVVRLRGELTEERKLARDMDLRLRQYELHILKLENIMRNSGLEPPTVEFMNV